MAEEWCQVCISRDFTSRNDAVGYLLQAVSESLPDRGEVTWRLKPEVEEVIMMGGDVRYIAKARFTYKADDSAEREAEKWIKF